VGHTVSETNDILKKELRDPNIEIASIGPGGREPGKNGVNNALHNFGHGSSGRRRGDGSKKLKAIAVRGSGVLENADNKKFYEVALQNPPCTGTRQWSYRTV